MADSRVGDRVIISLYFSINYIGICRIFWLSISCFLLTYRSANEKQVVRKVCQSVLCGLWAHQLDPTGVCFIRRDEHVFR